MKIKRKHSAMLATLLFACLFPFSLKASGVVSENQAVKLLQKQLNANLSGRGLSWKCLDLLTEDAPARWYQYALQEKHGGGCPGDPDTSPIIDRYRVNKGSGAI